MSELEFCVRVKTVDNLGSKWDKQNVYIETTSEKKVVIGKTAMQAPTKGSVSWPDSGQDSGIMCMSFPSAGMLPSSQLVTLQGVKKIQLTFQLWVDGKKRESIFKWKLDILAFKGQEGLITNKIKKGDSPCLSVCPPTYFS